MWHAATLTDADDLLTMTPVKGRQMKLTDDLIRKTPAPAAGSITLWDGGPDRVRGFGIRINSPTKRSATGARSFFINYRHAGREARYTIGAYPTWTVTAARAEARELRKRIDQGEDPASEKRARREAPTVQDLIDRYIADHLPNLTEREQVAHRTMLGTIGDYLGRDRAVAGIHFGDVEAMHKKITASGRPIRANRILGVASKAFSLSLIPLPGEDKPWRDAAVGNPCKGVERNHEEARDRFFSASELTAIGDALNEFPGRAAADCVRLVMLTGCRPGEAMAAKWSEFDQEPGYWIKPSAHTKQRKTHRAPLTPAAVELIARRRQERADKPSEWVFPSDRTRGEPIATLWHVWEFVRDRAELGDTARIYDLRHTFASVGAGGGLSLQIIGKLLGHTLSRTTERYAHLADDPLREAADKIGSVIAGAANNKPGAAVVPIKGGRAS
jgi:integrase